LQTDGIRPTAQRTVLAYDALGVGKAISRAEKLIILLTALRVWRDR
jgi:hypothetical protein